MLKLLRSIFARNKRGKYPESLVRRAIERAVDGTNPSMRAVSGYRKILRPAVLHAIDHVVAMADALPPPIPLRLRDGNGERPLKGYFVNLKEYEELFRNDRELTEYLKHPQVSAPVVVALLAMDMQEKKSFGAVLCGEMVAHDVPLVTVTFEGHRLFDPAGNEEETRRFLKRRAFDQLLSLALKKLTVMKSEREELNRRRALLQAKLNLLKREGWGFDSAAKADHAEAETRLAQIEEQLKELGGDFGENEAYVRIVAEVLGNAERYLSARCETLLVNQLGVKQAAPATDVHELCFIELRNNAGRRLAVMLVELEVEDLRRIRGG